MTMQLKQVAQICQQISRQIKDSYKPLTVHYIVHHDGQRNEAMGVAAQEIIHHPAAETALRLMQQPRLNEESSIIGTAVARTNIFLGLAWRDHLLTTCNINIDHLNASYDVKRQAWHLGWHAIDSYEYHQSPDNHNSQSTGIVVRRRSALEMARANLQADIMSVIMCHVGGEKDVLRGLAKSRALNTLSTSSGHMPEFYPYPISWESTKYAIGEISDRSPSKRQLIPMAVKLAREISLSISDESVMNWFSFCEPAQDMAWRGFSKENILSSAINTSPETDVRAVGHLIKEITEIQPSSLFDIQDFYSPYADDAVNEKLHEKLVEQIFEDIIAKGLSQHSPDPFIKLADSQNQALSEGRMIGWCAAALQAAARMMERLPEGDKQTENIVRRELMDRKNSMSWEDLQNLSDRVVEHQRKGEIITMSRLAEIAGEDQASKIVQTSVQNTINNPDFQKRMEYASQMAPRGPQPRSPAPSAAPRMAQHMNMGAPVPAGPGMGGGMRTTRPVRTSGGKNGSGQQGRQDQQ